MNIPRIVLLLLLLALLGSGCATGYAEHQAAIAAFNADVANWNASWQQMQFQLQRLAVHPGRSIEPQLNEAIARAVARGASTLRAMIDAATEELTPVSVGWRPEEREYAEAMRRLAYGMADLADQREQIERRRQLLTQQSAQVAAAEQNQLVWLNLLGIVLAGSASGPGPVAPPAPALPTMTPPPLMPRPVQCVTQGNYTQCH
jgi:hypothetical protein